MTVFRFVRAPNYGAKSDELCAEARFERSERIAEVLAGKSGIWAFEGLEDAAARSERIAEVLAGNTGIWALRAVPQDGARGGVKPEGVAKSGRRSSRSLIRSASCYFARIASGNSAMGLNLSHATR